MLFFAGLTAILTTFALGLLWPHRTTINLGAALWGYFAKALYLTWGWFLISYFSDLGDATRIASLAFAVFIAQLILRNKIPNAVSLHVVQTRAHLRTITIIVMFLIIAYPALISFGDIFTLWDAVVSWNRWGIELSDNTYSPLSGAYPILWPAVWSLIYEAQNSSTIWFVSKATICAPLIFAALFSADLIKGPHAIASVALTILIALCFSSQSGAVVSGYMDIPLALLGLGALLLIILAIDETNEERRKQLLHLSTISVAIAMVTKQGGVIFAAVVAVVLIYESYRKTITLRELASLFVLAVLPIVSYLWLYDREGTDIVVGNLDNLIELTASKRGGSSAYTHAFNLLADVLPNVVWPLLGIGIVLNIIFFRSYKGAFGLLSLLAGCVTFIIFATCCAYNVRNGYIALSFFIASAFSGYSLLELWMRHRVPIFSFKKPAELTINLCFPIGVAFSAAVIALVAISMEWPAERLAAKDIEIKYSKMGILQANELILRNTETIKKYNTFATSYPMAKYLPLTKEAFLICTRTDASCLTRARKKSETFLVLSFLTFETDATNEFIKQSIANKTARYIDRNGGFTLYEFR